MYAKAQPTHVERATQGANDIKRDHLLIKAVCQMTISNAMVRTLLPLDTVQGVAPERESACTR